ncbi:MAG: TonB C-terminal domain-containing protein [Kofleriaceae bacterium]
MSLNDNELHIFAGVGVTVLTSGLAFLFIVSGIQGCGSASASTDEHPLDEMEAIEASIAYKKSPAKQPQKKTKLPDPVQKPDGVSHDDKKPPPDVKKPPDDKKKPDKTDPNVTKIPDRRETEDVNSKPVTDVGEFNDSTRGFAETTSGDPYFRELAADFHENWEFPKILSASGSAAGCLHILADGTIQKTKVDPKSGDSALDDSIERALKKIEKLRNDKPQAVPTHLLKQATTRWICFKSNPQEQQRE